MIRVGDRVVCRCAPGCELSWIEAGARALDGGSPPKHGPCVRGLVLEVAPSSDGLLALVRQDRGAIRYRVPMGLGQWRLRSYAPEVWCAARSLEVEGAL